MKGVTKELIYFLIILAFGISSCNPKIEKSNLVSIRTFNYPVLKEKTDNPVLRIAYEADLDKETINAISLNIGDTKLESLKSVRIYFTGQDSIFKTEVLFGEFMVSSNNILIEGSQLLEHGKNFFWVSFELTENTSLTETVSAELNFIQTANKKLSAGNKPENLELRTGVAVRQHKQDNVHTYRIPGLATTNDGTLLAIYDVRRDGGRDLQGHMDIGVSRSTDGGNNWEPMRIALDMGEWGGLPEKFNGVSDANILVDKNTGDIYIAGLWMHGVINADGVWQENLTEDSKDWNHQWRNKGSQPGLGVKQTSQFLITKSTDDGQTWGEAINLTEMCKLPEWWLWAPAPGHGITLEDGTLVFPTQGRDKNGETFSNITYSKDGGTTWITSKAAYHNTTESMAVQLSDGSLMLNMRDNRNRSEKGINNGRAIATTTDLGETWTEHKSSHGALIEPVCMASIHKHQFTDKNSSSKSVLFFSNPNSKYARHKQTIKVSFDEGLSWPEKYWIELDDGRGAGYSCLTSINENTIGILYEGSQAHMTFQAIDVSGILEEANFLPTSVFHLPTFLNMKPYILQETNWKHVQAHNFEIAVIPWGATEPHNLHLPYGTDTLETSKIAEIAAEKAWDKKAKVMVLPTIPFGVQNPGQIELPFCLHVTPSTQKIIFADIVKALYNQGITKIVIMNGHGGNDFKPIIRELQAEYKNAFLGLIEWFRIPEMVEIFDEPGDHADEVETSVMQYLFPDLVLPLEEAGDGKSTGFKLDGLNKKVAWTPRNWQNTTESTGVGNPKKATIEKGQKCVETVTTIISNFLVELAEADLNDLYE